MKRVPPPDLDIANPPPSRRRRALSAEERALWEAVAHATKPLKKRPRLTKIAAPVAAEEIQKPATKAAASSKLRLEEAPAKRTKPEPPALASLGRRERSQLSRGIKDIDARIDLHGMTQARAHRALLGFLQRASDDGLSFVLIITGKGRTTAEGSERGVLRRQVPEWLGLAEFRSCVVGFEEAHIGHGGGGALYVRVRRRRF
jgi:DNA-nicking Smr family endonuclease